MLRYTMLRYAKPMDSLAAGVTLALTGTVTRDSWPRWKTCFTTQPRRNANDMLRCSTLPSALLYPVLYHATLCYATYGNQPLPP